MSPLRTRTLLVELAPDQVNLAFSERRLTLRGPRTAMSHEWLPVASAGPDAAPWRGAVQALEQALAILAVRPARARVVLSTRLVRYALVPWSDALGGADEEAAFARHCFERVYGDAAAEWELRVSDEQDGAPRLASAVDAALPGALRDAFGAAGIWLESIQPALMAVCNAHRRRLSGRHAWLALIEPGTLCVALRDRGRWARVRSVRIGPGWRAELVQALARETYLVEPDAAARDVFLWACGLADVALPEDARWRFHLLAAPQPALPAAPARLLLATEG